MFGWFWRTPEERRARFVENFIRTHYSTYRASAAECIDNVVRDAEVAWRAINGQNVYQETQQSPR